MRGLCVRGRCMRGCACEAVHARLPPAASTSSTRRRPRPGARRRGASARAAARRGRGAAAAARRCRRPPVGRQKARRVGESARVEGRGWSGMVERGRGEAENDWEGIMGRSRARSRRDLALATNGSGRCAARRRNATIFANCVHDVAPLVGRLRSCGAAVLCPRLSTWDRAGVGGCRRFCGCGCAGAGYRGRSPITGMLGLG